MTSNVLLTTDGRSPADVERSLRRYLPGLDTRLWPVGATQAVQTELLALQAETCRTIVFVTHDLDEALRLGHRLAILHEGRVLQVGTPDELLMQPADDHVAAFVRGVNRTRAWTIGAALAPWPPHLALPPLEVAVDETPTIEQVLPRLAGRAEALAVQRGGRIAGCVDVDKLRRMLD